MHKIPFTQMSTSEALQSVRQDNDITKEDVMTALESIAGHNELAVQVILTSAALASLERQGRISKNVAGGYDPKEPN